MSWKIDRDYLALPGDRSDVGKGQWPDSGEPPMPYRFRLLDGDGEVYYGGRYSEFALDGAGWGSLYDALKWGESNAGCADLQVKVGDFLALGAFLEDHAAKYVTPHATRDGWYSVYA